MNEIIVLTRNGEWLADGTEITHEPTRRLFARSLKHEADGWYLRIGHESKRIEVEDTAYFVIRIDHEGKAVKLTLNDETFERLDPATLAYRPGRLICRIKGGNAEAKFLQAPYMDLMRELEEDARGYFIRIGGARVEIQGK